MRKTFGAFAFAVALLAPVLVLAEPGDPADRSGGAGYGGTQSGSAPQGEADTTTRDLNANVDADLDKTDTGVTGSVRGSVTTERGDATGMEQETAADRAVGTDAGMDETGRDQLPATASPLPLIGLAGLLSFGAGSLLRRARRG